MQKGLPLFREQCQRLFVGFLQRDENNIQLIIKVWTHVLHTQRDWFIIDMSRARFSVTVAFSDIPSKASVWKVRKSRTAVETRNQRVVCMQALREQGSVGVGGDLRIADGLNFRTQSCKFTLQMWMVKTIPNFTAVSWIGKTRVRNIFRSQSSSQQTRVNTLRRKMSEPPNSFSVLSFSKVCAKWKPGFCLFHVQNIQWALAEE